MRKTIAISLFLVGAIVAQGAPAYALAQTTGTSTVQSYLDRIRALTEQIQALQNQLKALQGERQSTAVQLISTLKEGSQGDQVLALQALLAADPELYPEGMITGFYGRLTAMAVRRFQKKYGIEQAGIVGPKTLKKLNEWLKDRPLAFEDDDDEDDDDDDKRDNKRNKRKELCTFIPPGHLIAPGWLRKHAGEKDLVRRCRDNATSTPPIVDVTAPILSSIAVSNISSSSAMVSWTTNEGAKSKVYYGTASPLNLGSASSITNGTLVLNHSLALTGLTASTTYYFVVESKDASNNTVTSSESSFVTVPLPDIISPIISGVAVSGITSSTATVGWTTNESATSKVYYSLTSPLNLATASSSSDGTLVTTHSVAVNGLTATSTYYFVVESKDASNNMTTSSEQSFATP